MRTRGDGATSFDDTAGEVSGTFVTDRPPAQTEQPAQTENGGGI